MVELHADHAKLIAESAITQEVSVARGYRTVTDKTELDEFGFGRDQQRVPALLIPLHDVHGEVAGHLCRPDDPRSKDGRPIKYEMPVGARMVVDVPPPCREHIDDPKVPLFLTEGARKADAAASIGLCCIDLIGVWCFRGTNTKGGKALLPDFESIALNGRDVYVVFDSDVMEKESVHMALARFVPVLRQRGARVRIVYLPPGTDGAKVGLDDFLAAGGTRGQLLSLAEDRLRPMAGGEAAHPYEATKDGIVWHKPIPKGGTQPLTLTNFLTEVVADTVRDDGAQTTRWFTVEAQVHGRRERFEVEASQFGDMRWVLEQVGADAIIDGGQGSRERTRAAIQHLSGTVEQHRCYSHTGWREVDGAWVYLHAGGAIGADGPVEEVAVDLQAELERFELPGSPTTGEDVLREAVEASLGILTLAPASVTVPVLGAVYRAPLGPVDFSLFLTGRTGVFKTELAALAQQHWGAGLDARHLPASWSSTANWTEAVLFAAKDALCVVDDFAPGGTSNDLSRAHRDADRVFRSQGNQAGRGRMRADSSLRRAMTPRGLPVATGEDVPRGHSLRARMVIDEISDGDIDLARLTAAQAAAADGIYAVAMGGYVRWIASRYVDLRRDLPVFVRRLREGAVAGAHRRTSANESQLVAGFHYFLEFAEEAGAVTASKREAILEKVEATLAESGEAQAAHHFDADPVRRFLELLASELGAGRAHVAQRDGLVPTDPVAWGWHRPPDGSEWRPSGRRIGWIEGPDLYLDPQEAYACAQRLADELGERIPLDLPGLTARLYDAGLLVSTNLGNTRRTYRVRRQIQGRRREVLHLRAEALEPDPPDPARPTDAATALLPHGSTADRAIRLDAPGSGRSAHDGDPTSSPTSPEAGPHANDEPGGRTGRISEGGPTLTANEPQEDHIDIEPSVPGEGPDLPDPSDLRTLCATGARAATEAALRLLPWPANPPAEGTTWSEEL
jgi:hypothetical protein